MLVVEDDPRFARVATDLLGDDGYLVSCARNAREARALLSSTAIDAVVCDLGLPDADGVDLIRDIGAASPTTPILVLTVARARSTILSAIRAGASGYLFKEDLVRRLVPAVEELLAGEAPMSAEAARIVLERVRSFTEDASPPARRLTPREIEVLRELARGLTYEQVGLALDVSANTVRAHIRALYEKLDAATRTEAVLAGVRLGLLSL